MTGPSGEASPTPTATAPRYVVGDATAPIGDGPKILCHVVNDQGGWGRGFVLAVSKRWPDPERLYRSWCRSGTAALGHLQLVQVDEQLWVANMMAQHGLRPHDGAPPIRYQALDSCLQVLAVEAIEHDATVHMPRIGCGLAGGRWEDVEPLVLDRLCGEGIAVTVYDLPPTRP